MKKIYLAIPYSGMVESSYEQANKATAELMSSGEDINVFSPITHSHPLTQHGVRGDWEFWKKVDFQFIDWAEEVWVIVPEEGIKRVLMSVGVIAEINYANECKKPVKYLKRNPKTNKLEEVTL
jgi:Domain of unknown function (DUF1937)